MKDLGKFQIAKTMLFGNIDKHQVVVKILIDDFDKEDPSFSFQIRFPENKIVNWFDCQENCGGFEYDSEEDAIDAAMDYIIDHASFSVSDEETLIELENPEDNIEEVPEDFRLNMKH